MVSGLIKMFKMKGENWRVSDVEIGVLLKENSQTENLLLRSR